MSSIVLNRKLLRKKRRYVHEKPEDFRMEILRFLKCGEKRKNRNGVPATADAKFTIQASAVVNLPQTGDSSNLPLFALVGILAIAGFGLMMNKRS